MDAMIYVKKRRAVISATFLYRSYLIQTHTRSEIRIASGIVKHIHRARCPHLVEVAKALDQLALTFQLGEAILFC